MKKLTFIGSICSIIGIAGIFVTSTNAEQASRQIITGNSNTVIQTINGDVSFSTVYHAPKESTVINSSTGSTFLLKIPDYSAVEQQICTLQNGVKISTIKDNKNSSEWQKVFILSSPCKGKIGWITTNNFSYH